MASKFFFTSLYKLIGEPLELLKHSNSILGWPLISGLLHQHGHRVDVVRKGGAAQAYSLEWNCPTPSCRVQHRGLIDSQLCKLIQKPELFLLAGRVSEGPLVGVGLTLEALSFALG